MASKRAPKRRSKTTVAGQSGDKPLPTTEHTATPLKKSLDLPTIRRHHERHLLLRDFADIGQPPKICDVEIIVCFADLRGFTRYCNELQQMSLDNRIQNFLKAYFDIYVQAVLEVIWKLTESSTDVTATNDALRRMVVPAAYKNLGDGVMLVWEIEPDCALETQGRINHWVLSVIASIFMKFDEEFRNPSPVGVDGFSEKVKDLRMGFGIARGHAWKLDFGRHVKADYAGSIVNLAARLQDRARPEGIICQYELSSWLFDRLIAFQEKPGTPQLLTASTVSLKGLGRQRTVSMTRKGIEDLSNLSP